MKTKTANYSIQCTLTSKNKNGEWSKRSKTIAAGGLNCLEDAKAKTEELSKTCCKRIHSATNIFFAECFYLCNGSYIDCDRAIIRYDQNTDKIIVEECL